MPQRPHSLPARLDLACAALDGASEKSAPRHAPSNDSVFSPIEPLPTPVHAADAAAADASAAADVARRVPRRVVRPALRRTVRRMYRVCSRTDLALLLVPGVVCALVSGALPVAMTHVVGRAFAAFAAYDPAAPDARAALRTSVRTDVAVLLALAAGTLVLRGAAAAAWLVLGEHGVRGWRRYVFRTVLAQDMAFFDLGMGLETARTDVGAAGAMALFLKDTDDVRTAMGAQMGYLVVHAAAGLASLGYALGRQWALTLVIFAALPLLAAATVAGDVLGAPLHAAERTEATRLAALVEKGVAAIRTLKAFNAQALQRELLDACAAQCRALYTRMCVVWGVRYGVCAALALLTFVQGFAYGGHLVRTGRAGPDVVLATFLASLVAMGQLQSILLRLSLVERGKNAAASLEALATSRTESDAEAAAREAAHKAADAAAYDAAHDAAPRRTPKVCSGEMALEDVWMAYPTRPDTPALRGVSLYFAAGEHTFVVGRSGSGKSTVASLLLQLHAPQAGRVTLDLCDVRRLDPAWFRTQVAGVAQDSLLLEQTLFENVAAGARTPRAGASVRQAVCAARLDDVLDALPDGLDTRLGTRGTALSGGQRQRVALARALLRDASVLVLDEATSALDAACAAQVHAAVRAWRRGRTTIVITHDLAHVRADDYCYVLDAGRVVEEGFVDRLARRADGWLLRTYPDVARTAPRSSRTPSTLGTPPRSASVWSEASDASGKVELAELAAPARAPDGVAPERVAARHRVPSAAAAPVRTRTHAPHALRDALHTLVATQPHRAALALALVGCVASGVTTPAFAYCLAQVLLVVGRASAARLAPLIGATAGVALADGLLKGVRLVSMEALTARWVASLRRRAMARVLVQDARFFDCAENAPSAIATALVKDAEDAGACLGQLVGQLVALLALVVATGVWAFVQGWLLTLCVLALLPPVAALYAAQGWAAARAEAASKAQREHVAHVFFEQVAAVRGVRAMALDDALRRDAHRAIDAAAAAGRAAALASAAGAGLAEATTYAAEALLYGVGAALLLRGTYDLHRLLLVLNPVIFAVGFAAQLAASFPAGTKSVHALCAVARLLRLGDAASDARGDATPALMGAVEFDGVTFGYGAARVLDAVSFRIHAGERVALVGASGAGKSTVAALVQRLYEPEAGAVRIDGHWARTLDAAWLRAHIAVVSQAPTLFATTVRDNIALGSGASDAEVRHAAARAGAAAFIEALPEGYATRLGADATQLSGGQAQRVALARALVRRAARILVLDEFTAALDPATRGAVADEVLRRGAAAPTVLMLTHDAALMQQCDRLLVLDAGRVAYDGPPAPWLGARAEQQRAAGWW